MSVTNLKTAAARTSRLSKTYRQGIAYATVLDEVDIEFERGQFTALMGPAASGKSTLLHCLAGLERPTGGEVWVGETRLTGLDEEELSRVRRERVGFIFQNSNLTPTLTVAENVILPFELAGRVLDHDYVELVVQTMGLSHVLLHRPEELSVFQCERVSVARALIGGPDVVLADEPTATLDAPGAAELLSLLRRGVDALGSSVIVATSDPEVAAAADRVIFLDGGRVAAEVSEPTSHEVLRRLDVMY